MQLKKLASFLVVLAGLVTASVSAFAADPENTMVITLKDGDVTIALRPDLAPKHVEQIKKLVRQGAYDNVAFHRVIDGFMAQTGDVKFGNMKKGFSAEAVGTGGSDLPDLPAEFSQTEHYKRGVVGMAARRTPIRPIRSSSSCSLRHRRSTASTPSSAMSSAAWNWWITSRRATRRTTARSPTPTG